ncbi:MAG: glucosaminidase domain-containing protein [Deltaproteobacteria bacterium]|nr:glucosaminidase domain-containing protein [Deltaproteobacteria bacterium]
MESKETKNFSNIRKSILIGMFIVIVFMTCLVCKYSDCFNLQSTQAKTINVSSTQELTNTLEKYNMLNNIHKQKPFIIIKRVPKDISSIDDVELREKFFIRILTPAAMVALSEVRKERNTLINILKKMNNQKIVDVNLDSMDKNDRVFLRVIVKKYRSNDSSELLKRIDEVPLNLILAQGAIESNWGRSRFAIQGNNLFGMWTYKHRGIKPKKSKLEDNHKVARYPSILDSVRAYIYNLNVGWAYRDFREARVKTKDAIELANYLSKYSKRGQLYIKDVKALSRRLNKQYAIDKSASYANLFN